MTSHMFTEISHVVTVPHGFASVVILTIQLYIPVFIKIRSEVLEPQGVKICPFPLHWILAFITAITMNYLLNAFLPASSGTVMVSVL